MIDNNIKYKPLVSVIVPTYNRAYCLARTIQCVLNQTFTDLELIIIDNHSTDDTDSLINSYTDKRIKYIKIHNDGVIAASRNKGIDAASGKYLAFLDSDDWWTPDKLEQSVQTLETGADFVYHDLYRMPFGSDKSKSWKRIRTWSVKTPVFDDLILRGNAIATSGVVVRKEYMKTIGGFSEDRQLIAAEDYEAWLRISKLTDNFMRLPDCLGYYTTGGDNTSGAKNSMIHLEKLLELYNDKIQELNRGIPSWMTYSLATSYYKTKIMNKAKLFSLKTLKGNAFIDIKIRSAMIWILSSIHSAVIT